MMRFVILLVIHARLAGKGNVKGLRNEGRLRSICLVCPSSMEWLETAWIERSRKCSGRCLGGSKT